jgi:SAM-dependent methyltransferase
LSDTDARPRLLNLACGDQAHGDWVNVEFYPHSLRYRLPGVGALGRRSARRNPPLTRDGVEIVLADLRDGVPFPDRSFDVVYHSNFLEHLDRAAAPDFLRECLRVLRPDGLLRMVVPDLEQRARNYLTALEEIRVHAPGSEQRYRFAVIDIFDQMVRTEAGGQIKHWIESGWFDAGTEPAEARPTETRSTLHTRVRDVVIGPPTPENTGELHRWWYDSHSLAQLVREAGFSEPTFRSPDESGIPRWDEYRLDTLPDGRPRYPLCLYVEAVRP